MLRFVFSTVGGLFTMLTMGTIMGALSLGAIFFVYGRTLPEYNWILQYAPQTVSRVYSGDGDIVDEFAGQRRIYVTANEIPDVIKHAFVSAEDQNFFTHPGFDVRGIAAAFVDAVESGGEDLRGASTITQQLMKILFLDGSITAERKVQELILAVRVEQMLDKERILEMYLNEIFLGRNSYGVAAAARTYFNKPLSALRPGEAAYLAALAQRPGNLHPVNQYEDSINRRNYVLREMFQNGYIDEATMRTEQEAPLETVQSGAFESFRSSVPDLDYHSAEIRRQLTAEFGEEEFQNGGYQVRSTIDPDLQIEAAHALQRALEQFDRGLGQWRGTGQTLPEEALASDAAWREALADLTVSRNITLENQWYPAVVLDVGDQSLRLGIEGWTEGDPDPVVPRDDISWMRGNFVDNFARGDVVHVRRMTADGDGSFIRWTLRQVPEVQGAFMAMDVNTGRVLALQGGFDYADSNFNRATLAMRQPGSAFKPFVYAAALDSGYTPATIVVDSPIEINTPQGVWRPSNYSNTFYGPAPLRTGIEQSRNLMTIRLAQEIGMDTVATYAERFGVYDEMQPVLANSLGAQETTLYDLVAAYSMFANGGERVQPTLIDRVQDRFGQTVYRHDQSICTDCTIADLPAGELPRIQTNRDRIMNAVTAYQITSMMQGVVDRGTARRAINLPVAIAGKTGTTNDSKDVWFVGFSSNIAAGCFIGYDTPRSMGGASGGGVCAPVFQAFMSAAIQEYGGASSFRAPETCRWINIDRQTGARLPDGSSGGNVSRECFRDGEEPVFGITFDGGFAIAADLPLVEELRPVQQVENSSGGVAVVGPRATFNTLSSGGLY